LITYEESSSALWSMILLMRTRILPLFLLVFTGISHFSLSAQQETPYILNGSAYQETCNCYQLTPDVQFQAGSLWNKNLIDLNQSFNFVFNVYLGCKDRDGADGIAFVLQPIGTNLGAVGQGIGFENIKPSIGIPIDTWQNFDFNDPPYDHIGIYKNGDLVNGTPNTLVAPVQAIADNPNIEDCQWHTFRIIWDANAHLLSAEIDNVPRVQTTVDMIRDIFGGNAMVYWGFTSATGGQSNIQKVCTSLNPDFSTPPGQNFCAPADIKFIDHSTSFGTVINWWWDFGDGTNFTGSDPPPHAYSKPGYYPVRLTIEANDGCSSDTLTHMVTIGSIPLADFKTSPVIICANYPVTLTDASYVKYGTISQRDWNFNNGAEIIQTADSSISKTFPEENLKIELLIHTVEGCVSAPVSKILDITLKPSTSISVQDACFGDPVSLYAGNPTPSIPVYQWYWSMGDGKTDSTANPHHYFPAGGSYMVNVFAVNSAGCSSDTASAEVTIYQTKAYVGNDTIIAIGQPLQLHASGGQLYQWTPATGLNDPTIADPVATLTDNIQYILKAYTSFGCPTYDTINIKAYRGPEVYVPNAFSPDNNGINDHFHPVVVGMSRIEYFEVFNRFGQKVYSNPAIGEGWDGMLNGKPQPVGAYVWLIRGQDYLGNTVSKKGTVVLIR
jgi:gliding motility-associated-like protein